jgi:hypothetical protein
LGNGGLRQKFLFRNKNRSVVPFRQERLFGDVGLRQKFSFRNKNRSVVPFRQERLSGGWWFMAEVFIPQQESRRRALPARAALWGTVVYGRSFYSATRIAPWRDDWIGYLRQAAGVRSPVVE